MNTLEQKNQKEINLYVELCEKGFFQDKRNDKWYGFGVEAQYQEYWKSEIMGRCEFVDAWTESEPLRGGDSGVWTWEQGRDCDGVRYGGASFCRCNNYQEYEAYQDRIYDGADGPVSVSVIPLDEVEDARGSGYSIDTFAEAAGY